MKILFYIHSLFVGGAETLVTEYLVELKKKGHDVVLVVNEKDDTFLGHKLTDNNIRIIGLFEKDASVFKKISDILSRKIWGCGRRWREIYATEKPDIVHIHTFLNLFEPCDFPKERIFCSFHSDLGRSLKIGGKKNYKKLRQFADTGVTFVALNMGMISDIEKMLHTDKIVYLPNGINLSEVRSQKYNREDFLKEIGLPDNSYIVGHVGRFHPVKNHDKLFEVFSEICKKKDTAYLMLIGTGSAEEIAHIEELKAQYGVGDKTVMLGVRSDAKAIMSIFDVFILTSKSESFSLVLIEAQALGIRCVASDVVPEEVICENCFSVSLDKDAEEWASIALSGTADATCNSVDKFDLPKVIHSLIGFYENALNMKKD